MFFLIRRSKGTSCVGAGSELLWPYGFGGVGRRALPRGGAAALPSGHAKERLIIDNRRDTQLLVLECTNRQTSLSWGRLTSSSWGRFIVIWSARILGGTFVFAPNGPFRFVRSFDLSESSYIYIRFSFLTFFCQCWLYALSIQTSDVNLRDAR